MSYETYTYQGQLDQLKKNREDMIDAHKQAREFINGPKFIDPSNLLPNKKTFDDLISKLEAHLITLTEETQQPMPTVPGGNQQILPFPGSPNENGGNRQTTLDEHLNGSAAASSGFSLPKVIALSVAFVISGLLAWSHVIPPDWFAGVLIVGFVFLFFDQIKTTFVDFFNKTKEHEETTRSNQLENWITESFQWIRERYTSAVLLVQIQTNSKKTLPDEWALPDTAEVLNNRSIYFTTTLPTEFLTRIDRIIISCEKNVWTRQQVLINAIAVTKSAAARGPT